MYNCKSCTFISEYAAKSALERLKHIAKVYGFASLADYYDICEIDCSYTDTKIGWMYDTLKNVEISRINCCNYRINLPRAIPMDTNPVASVPKVTYREYTTKNSTPEPLCITIHTKELDDVDATLAETFKYIYTIKDRMVNLTIM